MSETEQKSTDDLEREKLELEIRELKWGHYRVLAVSASIIVGVFLALFKAWGTLTDIQANEQAARSEAILRSSQLVLSLTGPLAGYEASEVERNAENDIQRYVKKTYPAATVLGAIALSVPVARQFPEMCEPLIVSLTELDKRGYTQAAETLTRLSRVDICGRR